MSLPRDILFLSQIECNEVNKVGLECTAESISFRLLLLTRIIRTVAKGKRGKVQQIKSEFPPKINCQKSKEMSYSETRYTVFGRGCNFAATNERGDKCISNLAPQKSRPARLVSQNPREIFAELFGTLAKRRRLAGNSAETLCCRVVSFSACNIAQGWLQ